ncbi:MAG: nucleotidyltransferase domain-containing protein [Sulfurospirillaceae bacterium]|nr:nucleotidyltransferase domain-containing protein [Sulfurospirillaceae bacterium]
METHERKMMFGFNEKELYILRSILRSQGVNSAKIFGSRALRTHKKGSDIDLTIEGDEKKIAYILNEESPLIYQCDVVDISKLTNKNLIEHIKRVGKSLF